jgi:hypothetical protein
MFAQNTAACVSLSIINNVKDRNYAAERHKKLFHQAAVKPSRATTFCASSGEGGF